MEHLPPPLILEILHHLPTSSLARSRLTSKTLNSLSYEVTSINLISTFNHYTLSRSSSPIDPSITPFKSVVSGFISKMTRLDSVSIAVDDQLQGLTYDDVEDGYDCDDDDLYLSDVEFVKGWLLFVAEKLKRLSVVDFWVQSCWRKSCLLALVSSHCQRLNELVIKNAWLAVDGLSIMSTLTSLTLEHVRFDDENLSKLNDCFPCLEILNMIGVGGLKEPKIYLQHLKFCQWTVSNVPLSLTIEAPQLVKLKLQCVKPRSLVLETPLLSDFHLTLEKAGAFDIGELLYLKNLQLESRSFPDLVCVFGCAIALTELSLDLPNNAELVEQENCSLDLLFDVFPDLSSISLGPAAYSVLEASFIANKLEGRIGMKGLKNFTARLVIRNVDVTLSFISFILKKCKNLSTIYLLIHQEFDSLSSNNFTSRCMSLCPRVQWKWGFWKEGRKDIWMSVGV